MNRLFALLAVFFLSSCVTGFRIQNNESNEVTILDDGFIKLQKLCDEWTFRYKEEIVVNSFYVKKFNFTLGAINQYTIEPEIDFNEYFESDDTAETVNDLRDSYNDLIVSIFENRYHTIPQLKNLESFIEKFQNYKKTMENYGSNVKDDLKKEFNEILTNFDKGVGLIQKLMIFNNKPIHATTMSKDEFRSFIETLKIGPKQTFAFKTDPFFKMLKRNLVLIETFYLDTYSDNHFDHRSNGTVEYALYLPFNDFFLKNPCEYGNKLPQFFSDKVNA